MKKRILFVGEHPSGFTGNSHMMASVMKKINLDKFEVAVFAGTDAPRSDNIFNNQISLIEGGINPKDEFGESRLINFVLSRHGFDALIFIGLDLWRYNRIFDNIIVVKKKTNFKWFNIFPYDLNTLRNDWLRWINLFDVPCVYSKFGYNLLKDHIKNLEYFHPPLHDAEKFVYYDEEKKKATRSKLFSHLRKDAFIFGFFGRNQFRKDPQRLIKAFFILKKEFPNIVLYLHTDLNQGVYNLEQYLLDCGGVIGDVLTKKQGAFYATEGMVDVYNSMDCLVNTSLQEGLSLTLLEGMKCGLPIIASDTTAHKELIADGGGLSVKCTDLSYLPILTMSGSSFIEAKGVNLDHLIHCMRNVITDKILRQSLITKGLERVNEWLDNVDDINELLTRHLNTPIVKKQKQPKILFVQHSSAGDVLMSTQCFKGLKERHPKKPLIYMTQKVFQDIIVGNPYVDEIIDYDLDLTKDYEFVYNPHGEKILPGGWNNLDVKLAAMYPYFCKVKSDSMFIQEVDPKIDLPKNYVVVHTSGGYREYRTYAHMDIVLSKLDIPAVQIGGVLDKLCDKAIIDLRGKLSWREAAWIMKRAKGAIVIDSFPSHLAGTLGTPVVVLFGPAPARVTGPLGDSNKIINLEPNILEVCQIISYCWGNPPAGKQKCLSPCINSISPIVVLQSIKKLLGDVK